VYYPWSFHSDAPGHYDFAGVRDVDRLHDLIEEAGLYLIARPGPYVCAEIDAGGLPGWLVADPSAVLRCRRPGGYSYSRGYMAAVREWFAEIVPRIARRSNLVLFQIENEYSERAHLRALGTPLADLAIRWLGAKRLARLASAPWLRRLALGAPPDADESSPGERNPYMTELYDLARRHGVRVPIFHNDVSPVAGRQQNVDLMALDRYPITSFARDWRNGPDPFVDFAGDEAALDAHDRETNPVFYPELQGGWYDAWGGSGYAHVRARLGADAIDATTKAALAARATLWTYYVFSGGVTPGYMTSPDVYSSYDYGAPIGETGATGARLAAVRALNEFLVAHEADLAATDPEPAHPKQCAQHFQTRLGAASRYVFLRNPTRAALRAKLANGESAELGPWATQIRVYERATGRLLALSPELAAETAPPVTLPPPLPRLERWRLSQTSPQLARDFDDSDWIELEPRQLEENRIDLDGLGLHSGCVWYRGTFRGPLDRLVLDARHLWSVWINGAHVASGDQLRNTLGVGADGARTRRVDLRAARGDEGAANTIAILVESLGHNKGFADDARNPRGLVSLDTGATRVRWRARGGLVRGERGMVPVVDFSEVERSGTQEVLLPHGWSGAPDGVALYETSFRLDGISPKDTALSLGFDPSAGRANLYLNGWLIGRHWPERGPQRRFWLPWGVLSAERENHLAVALWKRAKRASLGKLRLEVG
jgi:hypothetical protein